MPVATTLTTEGPVADTTARWPWVALLVELPMLGDLALSGEAIDDNHAHSFG
jgi:hypothetical protein